MRERYVLIGAGSAVFTRGLAADLIRADHADELALVDVDPLALEIAERLVTKMVAAAGSRLRVSASTDRRTVLLGATVIICTIGVGGRPAWVRDVEIPRKFGLFVPVGDTVGPGGSSRALRMIPPMVSIARDVKELAPEALFFNYGNPMGPIVRAINAVGAGPVVGLCHGVHDTAKYLAEQLRVSRNEMRYTAIGRNHLTWFTEIEVGGQSVMPRLQSMAAARIRSARRDSTDGVGRPEQPVGHPFSWRLLETLGAFPAPGDRHVVEFFPQFFRHGTYEGMQLGVDNAAFSFEATVARGDATFEAMRRDAFDTQPLSRDYLAAIGGEHEQVIDIVTSVRLDQGHVFSVNLPSAGAISDVAEDAVVEAPAVADGRGIRLLPQPALEPEILGTLVTRWAWDELIVAAAINGDRARFVQALLLDGYTSDLDETEALADALLEAQREFLGWLPVDSRSE